MRLENELVWAEMDGRWPRPVKLGRRAGGQMAGCGPATPFSLSINGQVYAESELVAVPMAGKAEYRVEVPAIKVSLRFAFCLEDQELVLRIPEVLETGSFRVEEIDFPGLWLATGREEWFWRHQTRRLSWSRHWCPGTATYDQWEEGGRIGDAHPELGPQYSNHACVWNEQLCVGVMSSVHVEPLVTEVSATGARLHGRAGQFRIRPGKWSYRLRGQLAEPLVVRVGILGDYDGNGTVDQFDAANWEGDRTLQADPLYHEAVVYKLFMDSEAMEQPNYRYADCLPIIRNIHQISGGLQQVVYLVGWQGRGHDTAYPCHTQLNPRLGTHQEFMQLIEEARQYNAIVSLHGNYDDSYRRFPEHRPELLSRDPREEKVWFGGHAADSAARSISHTLAIESGYDADRTRRLLELLPLRQTIHLDAHRPYNEVWLENGEHISAECEVQRGLIPLKKLFQEYGIDITTEDTDDEKRGIYHWVWIQPNWEHPYNTAMYHGRLPGIWRAGMTRGNDDGRIEGWALGIPMVKHEVDHESYEDLVRRFYSNWMYAHLLRRKRMTAYRVGEWDNAVQARYEDDTRVEAGWGHLHAWYEGIAIARDTDRFLPWRKDTIYAYSKSGGPQRWTLPAAWEGGRIEAAELSRDGRSSIPVSVTGRDITWEAKPGVAYRFTRSA